MTDQALRVRFAPSPTGYLHVGGARTALFNWLLARRTGGQFVLRIEDTDRSRHVEDSTAKILDDLRWLGLQWDEGPEVGGDHGPYFQSQRLDIYTRYCQQLIDSGQAYYGLETPEELQTLREQARREKRPFKHPRPDPLPTPDQAEASRQAGRPVTVRFIMPDHDLVFTDEILGEVRLAGAELDDFVIRKGDGWPTYHFACVVDDALMKIDCVLRGQEHLINTPRHILLQQALGFQTPRYAHLPIIFNMDGTKMSKRTAIEIDVHDFRVSGYLPEALLNFISLLGWSPGEDREQMTLDETVEQFDLTHVGKANARFDRNKLLAFNTDWLNRTSPDRLAEAFGDYLRLNDSPICSATPDQVSHLLRATKGFRSWKELEDKSRTLFVDDRAIEYDPKAVKKNLIRNDGAGYGMLELLLPRLESQESWTQASLEAVFDQVCTERETKLGNVAQPVRVAVTGTAVSPPIFDTLVLLGKDRTLARIRRCLTAR